MFLKNRQPRDIVQVSVGQRHPPHLLDEYVQSVALRLADQFTTNDFAATLRAIVRHRHDVDPTVREFLISVLLLSAERAINSAHQLADCTKPLVKGSNDLTKDAVESTRNIRVGTI